MKSLKARLERIIFESDTTAGWVFDFVLILSILTSVALVMLESVSWIRASIGFELYYAEWFFTVLFTLEYLLRILSVKHPLRYIFSFYGIVDLLAILPSYLSLLYPGAQSLLIVRVFRLLRIFRIFRLARYLGEGEMLLSALRASGPKIIVFVTVVISTVLTSGAVMYVVEGPASGFTSIPISIYWAVVTMTTVGYGDIAPQTPFGQLCASCLMITGYGVIAVPTGIVTTELARAAQTSIHMQSLCARCQSASHRDARFCQYCGEALGKG